jgi:hypothetical protein
MVGRANMTTAMERIRYNYIDVEIEITMSKIAIKEVLDQMEACIKPKGLVELPTLESVFRVVSVDNCGKNKTFITTIMVDKNYFTRMRLFYITLGKYGDELYEMQP